jgi:hypothetical protein
MRMSSARIRLASWYRRYEKRVAHMGASRTIAMTPFRLNVSKACDQSVTASIVWNFMARADSTTAPAMSQLRSALARPSDSGAISSCWSRARSRITPGPPVR